MSATDELRELAARMEWLALDTPDMLREAADAIDVLHESERRLMTQRNERLAKAEAENAKLREHLEYANNEWEKESMEYLSTQAENAKLREDLEFERSENGWAREFLDRMADHCGTKDCPSLVAYVTKLEAENARLREYIERKKVLQDFARLVDENSKLRELCGEMADELCGLGVDFDRIGWCGLRDELRELGIEVNV